MKREYFEFWTENCIPIRLCQYDFGVSEIHPSLWFGFTIDEFRVSSSLAKRNPNLQGIFHPAFERKNNQLAPAPQCTAASQVTHANRCKTHLQITTVEASLQCPCTTASQRRLSILPGGDETRSHFSLMCHLESRL